MNILSETKLMEGLTPINIVCNKSPTRPIEFTFDRDLSLALGDAFYREILSIYQYPEFLSDSEEVKKLIGKPLTDITLNTVYSLDKNDCSLDSVGNEEYHSIISNSASYKDMVSDTIKEGQEDLVEVIYYFFDFQNEDHKVTVALSTKNYICRPSYISLWGCAEDTTDKELSHPHWTHFTSVDYDSLKDHPIEERIDDLLMISTQITSN